MQPIKNEKILKGASVPVISNRKQPDLGRKKIIGSLQDFLKQGLSCEKPAFSIALGITLGTFPVLGLTTILCI